MPRVNPTEQDGYDATVAAVAGAMDVPLNVRQPQPRTICGRTDSVAALTKHHLSQAIGFSLISLQLLGLLALNGVGVWIVAKTGLPIPGNLVGMVLLYALLSLGVVELSWIETAGSFLIRHLAFFFIPITVGLMNAGALFAAHGIGIVVVLAVSAGIGVILAGWVSQVLLRKPHRVGGGS